MVWLGGQKQITILHLLLPFTIPQPQVLEKKQLSMWTTSGVSDPLYDHVIRSHNNEHCTLRRSQEDWVILKKMPIYNIAIVKNRRWMKNKWIIKEYLAKGISSLCLGMCYLLSKHKWKSQSWPKLIKRNCT